ncbi:MAG TPA: lycopene cyclase domain-containing protein [Pilimelia sp.]|nr:lycopene cyclase domain-containing protein [Pilimelia sp.]
MPEQLRYLAILAACLVLTLPLELALRARVYRRPRRLAYALAPVVVVFGAWDLVGTARGHWSFSPRHTLGLRIAGLPVEEWLFFLVVPVCAVLTYEAVGVGLRLLRRPAAARDLPGQRHG